MSDLRQKLAELAMSEAAQYGEAKSKSVIGKAMGKYPELRSSAKELMEIIDDVISEVNSLDSEELKPYLPVKKKKIENILIDVDKDSLQENVKRNYQRNRTLIDLTKIPQELENEILEKFRGAPFGDRSKLLNYFIKSRLKNLTETIGEF